MNPQRKNVMDFDDILPIVGEFGIYQKVLFLITIPTGVFMAFVYFTQIFLTVLPDEIFCDVPALSGLSMEERRALSIPKTDKGFSRCKMYDVDYAQLLANGTKKADPNWPQTDCKNGWFYDLSTLKYATIAVEQNWVCEREVYMSYAQSLFFVGAIFGGFISGWIADRYGRVPSFIFTNLVACVAGCLTATSSSFWEFAMWRFLVGLAFDNCFMMIYILVLEYVGPKYRTLVANLSIALWFTIGACILPWIALYLANWKKLAIATSAPLGIVAFAYWVTPESARWLVSKNKIDRAVKILRRVAEVNRKEVPDETFVLFQESCAKIHSESTQKENHTILDLFRSRRLRRMTIILIIIWMADALVFDGHARNVSTLGTNLFITFTVASATECPAGFVLLVILDRWGRRWVAFGTLIACGLFTLVAVILPVGIVATALAVIARFFINIAYNIGLQYAAELLPTVVRAQGVAFIHVAGFVAAIMSPFVVYTAHINVKLPLLILGLLAIFAGVLSLFLPETLNYDLPQTLEDGENFGKDQSFWYFPCIKKAED